MKDRIRELMEAQHMNQQTFSNYTGINTATLSGILTGRTQATIKVVNLIMRKFPNININWLMFGQGGMLSSSAPTPSTTPSANTTPDLFSEQNQETQQTSQPSNANTIAAHHTENSTSRNNQTSTNLHSDIMAVIPTSFEEQILPQHINTPSTPNRQQVVSPHSNMEQSFAPIPPKRKVTEIRVFYDDQTWEAFVPKKS